MQRISGLKLKWGRGCSLWFLPALWRRKVSILLSHMYLYPFLIRTRLCLAIVLLIPSISSSFLIHFNPLFCNFSFPHFNSEFDFINYLLILNLLHKYWIFFLFSNKFQLGVYNTFLSCHLKLGKTLGKRCIKAIRQKVWCRFSDNY